MCLEGRPCGFRLTTDTSGIARGFAQARKQVQAFGRQKPKDPWSDLGAFMLRRLDKDINERSMRHGELIQKLIAIMDQPKTIAKGRK